MNFCKTFTFLRFILVLVKAIKIYSGIESCGASAFSGFSSFLQSFSYSVSYLQGITAVLNLQRKNEQVNWGINGEEINNMARQKGVIVVDVPIR